MATLSTYNLRVLFWMTILLNLVKLAAVIIETFTLAKICALEQYVHLHTFTLSYVCLSE